ncbi:bark storage protein A [Rosa chinensis]|nr:bark storage protein A [Rosa chinensis]
MGVAWPCVVVYAVSISLMMLNGASAALSKETLELIAKANENGPYLGLVIPNSFEMDPLLQSPNFTSSNLTIDFSGRRFRFGTITEKKVILVMTGLAMINAGIATQLLLSLFDIEGVVHYGIAGNANPSLHLADVVIPQYWAHTALWNWQRYGNGPEDELPLESQGDYTRDIGYLKFANYTVNVTDGSSYDNLLNNIWYQPEEVFPINGTPEQREHAFWIPVDPFYYKVSQKLEDVILEGCLNSTTCLSHTPRVTRVQRGTSASIYLDNAAYRDFIYHEFNITPVDMESASVALICLQQKVPFIVIRALSDLAGGGSADSNEADTFVTLASNNSVTVLLEFVKHLSAATIS